MGRKANLKKIRRQKASQVLESSDLVADDPTEFVKRLEKQGYQLDHRQSCPELPNSKPKPQV